MQPFFDLSELVCPHVYKRDGQLAWRYLNTDLLECLLIIRRDILAVPIVVNDKSHTQRGYRCNLCSLPKEATKKNKLYATAHFGQAVDFVPKGMTADEARKRISEKKDLLPCNIRIETGTSWVHFDTYDNGTDEKITYFKG